MNEKDFRSRLLLVVTRKCTAVLCAALLIPGEALLLAQSQQTTGSAQTAAAIPPDQLDSLVAPIALYLTRCWLRPWQHPPILSKSSSSSSGWRKTELGQGPCRCCGKATLGSKRPGVGRSRVVKRLANDIRGPPIWETRSSRSRAT